jgi:hypothetical protein
MQRVRESVNDCLGKYDPFAIVCGTIATLAGVWAAGKVLSDPKGTYKNAESKTTVKLLHTCTEALWQCI